MKLLFSAGLLLPGIVSASSCWALYEAKAASIQNKYGYKTYVGGHVYVYQGNLGYHPGLQVEADIDNWAEDLVHAIKWGPYMYSMRSHDPRKEWLEIFRKSISTECEVGSGDYEALRTILKELMEDGSFCPESRIIEPGFLSNKSDFKKVLRKAISDQRFQQICKNHAVQDDSYRRVKDIEENQKTSHSSSKASKQ